MPDSCYNTPGYQVHRKDRIGKWGGGILSFVNCSRQVKAVMTSKQAIWAPYIHTETFSCVFVLLNVLKRIENNQLITWKKYKNAGKRFRVYGALETLSLETCSYKSKHSLLIAGVYRPPSYKAAENNRLGKNIENAHLLNREIVILGDFNIDFFRGSGSIFSWVFLQF